jgi:hypothetical protein
MSMQILIRNPSLRNKLKVTQHDAVRDEKTNKLIPNKYRKGNVMFIEPQQTVGVWIDSSGVGVFLEESPT